MKLETTWERDGTDYPAVRGALQRLEGALGGPPDIVFFFGAESCNPRGITEMLSVRWPQARVHGGSSCMGVMTRERFEAHPQSLGLLGIVDPRGAYGVGSVQLGADPRHDVQRALTLALEQAGRPGEVPAMVLLTSPPGQEEELLLGIAEVLGPRFRSRAAAPATTRSRASGGRRPTAPSASSWWW